MAAEVDFGDLELFEAFDHPEDSIPKPVHTRFKDDDGDEEDEHGAGDAELRERLRQCEETIEQLRAENILPARSGRLAGVRWAACLGGRGGDSGGARIPESSRRRWRAEDGGFGSRALPRGPASWTGRAPRRPPPPPSWGWVFGMPSDC